METKIIINWQDKHSAVSFFRGTSLSTMLRPKAQKKFKKNRLFVFKSRNELLVLNSCLSNYMPNNQFKKGELYSFITGKASTAIARRLQKKFNTASLNLTIEQWSVLYHLWKEDGKSQQELCNRTFRDKPSITRLVDNLEKLKLVKRVASKEDRRINMIYLTPEALKLQEQTMGLAEETLNEALQMVPPEQVEVCKAVLQIVYDNLK
jgi:DNA-binding MarR family transcriptional regulator